MNNAINNAVNNSFPSDFESGPKPLIWIDSREQQSLCFSHLPSEIKGLATADYSVRGCERDFAVERKSIPDLVQCCGSERLRFEAELQRLRSFRFRRLLIVGHESEIATGRYRSGIAPRSVFASLNAWQMRFDVPFVFSPSPESAAELIEVWAVWFVRERLKELEGLKA